jgi:hypothetical protein
MKTIRGATTSPRWRMLLPGAGLWLLLVTAWFLWKPGLTGGFIFDDFPNLGALAQLSSEPTLYQATQFVATGFSGPLGRPLSLATFAAQHDSWPRHPEDFVRVNLLIHLLNGTLLFWCLWRWRRAVGATEAATLPLAVATLWVLAPIQVTAVLYVVQRMALLAATFTLAGLLLHTVGRQVAASGNTARGYALMASGWTVGLTGTLAKESAGLFPLLLAAYEFTLLNGLRRPTGWRAYAATFMVLPTAALFAYLLWRIPVFAAAYEMRPFDALERGLTQGRVLLHYLHTLAFPSLFGARLLYDDFPISRSLLEPWTTLPALALWCGMTALALRWRSRHPVVAFAVLWFLAAHLLESTLLPLEIAFEHRNYLAIVGPLLALVFALGRGLEAPGLRRLRPVLVGGATAYLGLVAVCLWQSSSLWGQPRDRAQYWAQHQPDSLRAVHEFAAYLFVYGRPDHGRQLYEAAATRWPGDATIPIGLLKAGCDYPDLAVPKVADVHHALKATAAHAPTLVGVLAHLVEAAEARRCPRYSLDELRALVTAALEAPALAPAAQNLALLRSRLAEAAGDRAAAFRDLDRAIRLHPNVSLLRQGVIWALQENDLETARSYLAMAQADPRISRRFRWSFRLEIAGLAQVVRIFEEWGAMPDLPAQVPAPQTLSVPAR